MSESDIGDDVFNAGALTRLDAIGTALATTLTDSTGNQWKLTLLSKKLSSLTANPTTVTVNDITQVITRETVGTMRGRKVESVY